MPDRGSEGAGPDRLRSFGDPDSFAIISRTVKAWAARRGGSKAGLDVDDLIQEAAIAAWRRGLTSPGLIAHAAIMSCRDASYRDVAWKAGVAAGVMRRRGRGSSPPITLVDRMTIDEALDAIPSPLADAVTARHLLGMTIEEAAKALGAAVDTVRDRTRRALLALRPLLAPSFEGEWARPIPLRDPKRYNSRRSRIDQKRYDKPGRRRPKASPGSYTTAALRAKIELVEQAAGTGRAG